MIELSHAQKQQFFENGFVHIPGIVPQALIRDALRAINSSIGRHLDFYEHRILETDSLCPDLKTEPRILNLFEATDARALAESALGVGNVLRSKNVQIALNFPVSKEKPDAPEPHVDGFHPSKDGVPGSILPFTAIAGFFLNDLPEDWSANFTVWPGTHLLFEKYYREHPADPEMRFGIPPVDMPKPIQLKVKAGDMIFAHYLLAHTVSTNMSEAIRYAIYFRMNHVHQGPRDLETLGNVWKYWEGMKEISA